MGRGSRAFPEGQCRPFNEMAGYPTGPAGHLPIEMGRQGGKAATQFYSKVAFAQASGKKAAATAHPCFPTAVGKYPRSGG